MILIQIGSDSILCYHCSHTNKTRALNKALVKYDSSFISKGFVNWKDACASVRKHVVSRSSCEGCVNSPAWCCWDAFEEIKCRKMTQQKNAINHLANAAISKKTRPSMLWASGWRKKFDPSTKTEDCDWQKIWDWFITRGANCTSPEIQMKFLSLMANTVLRSIFSFTLYWMMRGCVKYWTTTTCCIFSVYGWLFHSGTWTLDGCLGLSGAVYM